MGSYEAIGLNLVGFIMGLREVTDLEKQTVTFSVITKNNIVTEIGRSYIEHPRIQFNGNRIKWNEDKFKDERN